MFVELKDVVSRYPMIVDLLTLYAVVATKIPAVLPKICPKNSDRGLAQSKCPVL